MRRPSCSDECVIVGQRGHYAVADPAPMVRSELAIARVCPAKSTRGRMARDRSSRLKGRQPREPMTRSKNMARIRGRDTVPEIRVSIALRQLGLGYRKHVTNLPGTPDFANRRRGWAIFVHGCFWHRHQGCRRATTPSTRAEYWIPKLAGNADRDNENAKKIEQLGLRVLVIWERQTRDVETIEDVLIRELIAWPD